MRRCECKKIKTRNLEYSSVEMYRYRKLYESEREFSVYSTKSASANGRISNL